MIEGNLEIGMEIDLHVPVPGFASAHDACHLDWSRRVVVPPGVYVIAGAGRSDLGSDGERCSEGLFYQLSGPREAWVRRNYLLAGQQADWPYNLVRWLEPLDWDEIWSGYLRMRVEGHAPVIGPEPAPSSGGSCSERTEERGAGEAVATAEGWLPDFDGLFEIRPRS
jgi:hypothetical protein